MTLQDATILYDECKLKKNPKINDYFFLPEIMNRTTAVRKAGEFFNRVCEKAGMRYDQFKNKRTLYSLRHTALQSYIREKGEKIELYSLAKNSGTSVQMLERFYLKRLGMTKEMVKRMLD